MSTNAKLPVFEVVGEAFSFGFRKFPAILVLNIVTVAVLFGPVVLLGLGLVQEFQMTLDPAVAFVPEEHQLDIFVRAYPVGIFYLAAALLLSPIVYTVIIAHLIGGKSLWLPRLNLNALRYFFSSAIISFSTVAVGALALAIYFLAFVGFQHVGEYEQPGQIVVAVVVLLIALYFIVRFSLVPVDVIANSKLGVSSGYQISKGHFWRLFAMYLIMIICLIVISIVISIASIPLQPQTAEAMTALQSSAGDQGVNMQEVWNLNFSTPGLAIYNVASLLLQVYLTAVMVALPVLAYKKITE